MEKEHEYLPENNVKRKTYLLTDEGRDTFMESVKQSGGNAVMIVHPFYPETSSERTRRPQAATHEQYKEYLERLQASVKRYQDLALPIIIFEQESDLGNLEESLNRMGIPGDIFIVPTNTSTPEPAGNNETLRGLGYKLKDAGLEKATVIGSYLWLESPEPRRKDNFKITDEMPPAIKQNDLQGCVGHAIERFLEAGVRVSPGFAAYPKQRKKVFQFEAGYRYPVRQRPRIDA